MEGDWNCDGEFDSGDLVVAFQGANYASRAVAGAIVDSNVSDKHELTAAALESSSEGETAIRFERDLASSNRHVDVFHEFQADLRDSEVVDELMANFVV